MQHHELIWKNEKELIGVLQQGSAGNPRYYFAFPVTATPVSDPSD